MIIIVITTQLLGFLNKGRHYHKFHKEMNNFVIFKIHNLLTSQENLEAILNINLSYKIKNF